MDKLLSLENYYIVRRVPLGITAFLLLLTLSYIHFPTTVDLPNLLGLQNLYLILSAIVLIYFVGFFLDILGPYKLHPLYRLQHSKFFLEIYEAAADVDKDLNTTEKIRQAESFREEIIYSLDEKRRSHLRSEMAIWVLLYNVSILFFLAAFLHLLMNTFYPISRSSLVFWLFIGLGSILSIVSRMRNISYNDKIIFMAS